MNLIAKIIIFLLALTFAETAMAESDFFKTYAHVKKRVDQAEDVFNNPAQSKDAKLDIITKACNYATEKQDLPQQMRCLFLREQLTGRKFRVANALGPAEHFYRLKNYELALRFYKDAYIKKDKGLTAGKSFFKGAATHRFQAIRSALEQNDQAFLIARRKIETEPLAVGRRLSQKGYYKEANEYLKLYVPKTYNGTCSGISSHTTLHLMADTALNAGDYTFAISCLEGAIGEYKYSKGNNADHMKQLQLYENLILSGVKLKKSEKLPQWLDALYADMLTKPDEKYSLGPISEERTLKRIAASLKQGGYAALAQKVEAWPRLGKGNLTKGRLLQVSKDCEANNLAACKEKFDIIRNESALLWGEAHALEQLHDDTALKLCDLGEMEGCSSLGQAYLYGPDTQTTNHGIDSKVAQKFFKKGCDNDHAQSCHSYSITLGRLYNKNYKNDKKLANRARRKACKLGVKRACN